MNQKWKNILTALVAGAVFLLQLYRGFAPPPAPEPGMIPSGGMPATEAVVCSALLAGFLAWAALEVLFWLFQKLKK